MNPSSNEHIELRSNSGKLTITSSQPLSAEWQIVGIDVSRCQKEIDWQQALNQEISFAFIKSSEGNKIIDSQFERNMAETARLGIPRGIYHFLKPSHDWKKQVELFAGLFTETVPELDAVIDIERHDDLKKSDLANVVEKFVKGLEDAVGQAHDLHLRRLLELVHADHRLGEAQTHLDRLLDFPLRAHPP